MRNVAIAFLLLLNIFKFGVLPASQPSSYLFVSIPSSLPYSLVVDIFETACAEHEHFADIGVEELINQYYHGTATIEYLGPNPVNPSLDRYRLVAGGGTAIVDVISET